jgi:ribosomal subunit interface protein
MQVPLQIVVRNLHHSEALEARVREDATKLETFHPRIVSCRVTIEESRKHQRKGRLFQVRIDARIPGRELVVDRDHHEDVYIALRDAFHAMTRKLEDAARTARGDVKAHQEDEAGEERKQ